MKKKRILISLLFVIACFLLYGIFYFFIPKKYTFYTGNMEKITAVSYECADGSEFYVRDREIIKRILEKLGEFSFRPVFSWDESQMPERYFVLCLFGEKEDEFICSAEKYSDICKAYVSMTKNGTDKHELIQYTRIDNEKEKEMYDMLMEITQKDIPDITVEELIRISENRIYDWTLFQEYMHTEERQDKSITVGSLVSDMKAVLPISGKNGYVELWFYSGWVANGINTNEYNEVLRAYVYSADGECRDLYGEDAVAFLEEIE